MPELELDTVFEAGELSTGDVIDSSSSASSNKNINGGESTINDPLNISRPHQSRNEVITSKATLSTSDAKNINSNLLVVPNSIPLTNKITTVIHEPPSGFSEAPAKLKSINLSNHEKLSTSETLSSSTISKLSYSESNEVILSSDAKIDTMKEETEAVEVINRYTKRGSRIES